ncbi:hypothetical protein ACIA5G_32590 [Amycolatopsis sp. NPDC051758]|uniref:hypothetical protein n=1 Tax=Amycolatopsis sp. NPDC051758 TaxID=3363935 RepID=UPI00378E01C9
MTAVVFPAVVHAPHYEVLVRDRRGWPEQTNQRLYRYLPDAQRALVHVPLPGDFGARIVEYDTAYYTRCVVCGEFPDRDEWCFSDWQGVVQYLAPEPGWMCTSEQLVFCPNHRPERED